MPYLIHPTHFRTTVVLPPSPADSGTTLTVSAGDGTEFSSPVTAWIFPPGIDFPKQDLAEEVRVVGITGDSLSLVRSIRARRAIGPGDQLYVLAGQGALKNMSTINTIKVIKHLTAAQVRALFTTPVEFVAAPGPGKFINVIYGYAELLFGAYPYPAVYIGFLYNSVLASQVANINGTTDKIITFIGGANESKSTLENQALYLSSESDMNVGPILTLRLNNPGVDYLVGDPLVVNVNNVDGSVNVDSVETYSGLITKVNQTCVFIVAGDVRPPIFAPGTQVKVVGSTGNDNTYASVGDAQFDGTNTTIALQTAALPSPVVDGTIRVDFSTVGSVDQGLKQIIPGLIHIAGGSPGADLPVGQKFLIIGSPGNDGEYTVATSPGDGSFTTVESIPSPDSGGDIWIDFGDILGLTQYQGFQIAGDQLKHFVAGRDFTVSGSTGNDGLFNAGSVLLDGISHTALVVSEPIPSAVVDGSIDSPYGPITAISLLAPGTGYAAGESDVPIDGGSSGSGATVDILTIRPGDGALIVTAYYTVESVI